MGVLISIAKQDNGTCFKVWMLSEPKIMEDDEAIAEQLKTIS